MSTPTLQTNTRASIRTGVVAGVAAVGIGLVYGFVAGAWSLANAPPLVAVLGEASLWAFGAVVTVGVPVAVYLRFGLVSPLVVPALVAALLLGGLAIMPRYAFGLAFYAIQFWSIYLLAYLVFGGVEHALRTRWGVIETG